jgi:D-alanine transfer protein
MHQQSHFGPTNGLQAGPLNLKPTPSSSPPPEGATPRPHLAAALMALLIASAALVSGLTWCRGVEDNYVHELAPDLSDSKLQGVALQKTAFAHGDLLVLYGSSELAKEVPNRSTEFFEDYPTGFRVFPVGKAGTTALAIAQKVAAVGGDLSGRKVALSLSPSAFFTKHIDPGWYAGNFSALQATEFAFSDRLSFELKRDIARRMQQYPKTLQNDWLLDFAVERLAAGTAGDHVLYGLVYPLGRLQTWVGRAQDHFEAAIHILNEQGELAAENRRPRKLNWPELIRRGEQMARALAAKANPPKLAKRPKGSRDAAFREALAQAEEWRDLEMLLRAFHELGAKPLVLSMPVHGGDLETTGVSRIAQRDYFRHLESLTQRYGVPMAYYHAHEEDPTFFVDNLDHLGPKGWVYYNQTLDQFFHGHLTQR